MRLDTPVPCPAGAPDGSGPPEPNRSNRSWDTGPRPWHIGPRGLLLSVLLSIALITTGCGGGGSGGGGDTNVAGGGGSGRSTAGTVTGQATKGPFREGSVVNVFGVTPSGAIGANLGATTVGAGGSFTVQLSDPTYSGPILIEVSGTFDDELGGTGTVSPGQPLRAALPAVNPGQDIRNVAVTPLTHIAARLAEGRGGFRPETITETTEEVSDRFGIADPAGTLPDNAANSSATASSSAKEYGIVLAGLSQEASRRGVPVADLVRGLGEDAADGALDGTASTPPFAGYDRTVFGSGLQSAIGEFVQNTSRNRSGITTVPASISRALTRATLAPGALRLPATAIPGEGLAATLPVANTGGNAATLESAALTFDLLGVTAVADPGNPTSIAPGQSVDLQFSVSVALGTASVVTSARAQITAKDAVTGDDVSTARSRAGQLTIQSPPSLSLGVLEAPQQTVAGATFIASIPVSNSGQRDATITTATLSLGGGDFSISANAANPTRISGGQTSTFRFTVTVSNSAALGSRTGTFTLSAADAESGSPIAASRTGLGPIQVVTPAVLSITGVSVPNEAFQGETIPISVDVANGGAASATIREATLSFSAQGLSAQPSSGNPATVPGGSTSTFRFSVPVPATASPGAVSVSVSVVASDTVGATPASVSRNDAATFEVKRAAGLDVESVQAPAVVSRGQSFTATMTASNTGQASALIRSVLLEFPGSGFIALPIQGNPARISGGQTASFEFRVTVDRNAPLGLSVITGKVNATDEATGQSLEAERTNAGSITVQTPAALSIGVLVTPATVSRGQTLSVTLPVTNSGQGSVNIGSASLDFGSSAITATPLPGNPTTIAGGATADFVFTVTVNQGAATGAVTARADFIATDANGGGAVNATRLGAGTFSVQTPAQIALSGLILPATLSRGQAFTATATVSNQGQAMANIASVALSFGGGGLSTLASPTPPATLAGGASIRVTFAGTVAGTAATGASQATLTATATDANSGANASATLSNAGRTTVQTPARIAVDSLTVSHPIASQGQTLRVTAALRNSGEATANLTSAAVAATPSGLVSSPQRTLAQTLAGGGTTTLTFDDTVASVTTAGAASVRVDLGAVDANSGLAAAVDLPSLPAVTVQQPPNLAVTSITTERTVLSIGQSMRATLTIANSGQATGRVTRAALVLNGGQLSTSEITSSTEVPGSGSAAITFIVTGAVSGTATLLAPTIEAVDVNTGGDIAVSSPGSFGTVQVQSPASLLVTALAVERNVATVGQTFLATATFRNIGEAGADLTSGALVFDSAGLTASSTSLSGQLGSDVTTSFSVLVTAASTGTIKLTSATVDSSDANSGERVTLSNTVTGPPEVTVQSAAALVIGSLTGQDTASRGQTIRVSFPITNNGSSDVSLSTIVLDFTDSNIVPTAITPLPAQVAGLGTETALFDVAVGTAASLGTATGDITVTGTEDNTGRALTATLNPAGTVSVQTTPQVEIQALEAPDRVSRGQTFLVTVPVFNAAGSASAQLSSVSIALASAGLTPSLDPSSPTSVPGGQTSNFTFSVTAGSGAETGPTTVTATFVGTDSNTGVQVTTSTTTEALFIVEDAASLTLSNVLGPATATRGFSVVLTLPVSNTGSASANVSTATLALGGSGITVTTDTSLPLTIAGGTEANITFTVAVDGAATASNRTVSVLLNATDVNSSTDVSVNGNVGSLTVQTTPTLSIGTLMTQTTASRGQSLVVTLPIVNPLSTNASVTLSSVSMTFSETAVTGSAASGQLPATVAGGATALIEFELNVDATAPLVAVTASAVTTGADANVGTVVTTSLASFAAFDISAPPSLSIGTLTSPPTNVSQGQVFDLTVPISNASGAAASDITAAAYNFTGTGLSAVTQTLPGNLPAGSTKDLTFQVTASTSASVGPAAVGISQLTFTDLNSGQVLSTSKPNIGGFTVQKRAQLSFGAISFPTLISQGQTVQLTLPVTNGSGAAGAATTGITVSITRSPTDFTLTPVAEPSTIAGGVTTSYLYDVTISSSTATGAKTITVQLTGRDFNTGLSSSVTDITQTIQFNVQQPPVVTVATPSIPASVARSEDNVPIRFQITNSGGAAALIDDVTLSYTRLGGADVTSDYSPPATPGQATSLGGFSLNGSGGTTSVELAVSVIPSASITSSVTVSGAFTGRDANTLLPITITSPSSSSWEVVTTRPALRVTSIKRVIGAVETQFGSTASRGQTTQFNMVLENDGGAGATLVNPGLKFRNSVSGASTDTQFAITTGAFDSNLAAKSTTTIPFNVAISSGATLITHEVGGVVTESSQGQSITAADFGQGSVVIQQASSVVGNTTVVGLDSFGDAFVPSGIDRVGPQGAAIRARVVNPSGAATLNIEAATLFLSIGGVEAGTQYTTLPPSLPVVLSGGQTTLLTFTASALSSAERFTPVELTIFVSGTDANTGSVSSVTLTTEWLVREAAGSVRGQNGDLFTRNPGTDGDAYFSPFSVVAVEPSPGTTHVFISDSGNNRVLIYTSAGSSTPSTVIGQLNLTGNQANRGLPPDATTLSSPQGLALSGTALIVADSGNNRVLVYEDYTNLPGFGGSADRVFGQGSFVQNTANRGATLPAPNTLSSPAAVGVTQNRLIIADTGNNRVLVFEDFSTLASPGTSATFAIGQTTLSTSVTTPVSAGTLNTPLGLALYDDRLVVADTFNSRVLIYNDLSSRSSSGTTAQIVLGQPDMTSTAASTTVSSFQFPQGVHVAGNRLLVADTSNNRVLSFSGFSSLLPFAGFDASTNSNGQDAEVVYGQGLFTTSAGNDKVSVSKPVDGFSMFGPTGVHSVRNDTFRVADQLNNRVLLIPVP